MANPAFHEPDDCEEVGRSASRVALRVIALTRVGSVSSFVASYVKRFAYPKFSVR